MSRYDDQVLDEFSRPVPNATIYVYDDAGDLDTLTADDASPLANPLTTDLNGLFYFNAADGEKLLDFRYGGRTRFKQEILVGPLPTGPVGPAGDVALAAVDAIAAKLNADPGVADSDYASSITAPLTALQRYRAELAAHATQERWSSQIQIEGWSEYANASGVRFLGFDPGDGVTQYAAMSERSVGWNDGEDGFRLVEYELTWNPITRTYSRSAFSVVAQHAGWAVGSPTGSYYSAVALPPLPSGRRGWIANRLNPIVGGINAAGSSLDVVLLHRLPADLGWTETVLFTGAQFYSQNGLTPWAGAGVGMYVLPAEIIVLDDGSWVLPSYAHAAVGESYITGIRCPNPAASDGLAWQWMTPFQGATGHSPNEVGPAFKAADGSVLAYRRDGVANGRTLWRYTVVGGWFYVGFEDGFNIQDVMSAGGRDPSGNNMVVVSGSSALWTDANDRNFHTAYLSFDEGLTPIARGALFAEGDRVGYARFIFDFGDGSSDVGLIYESSGGGGDVPPSFNMRCSGFLLRMSRAEFLARFTLIQNDDVSPFSLLIRSASLTDLASSLDGHRRAALLYDAHERYVAAQATGTIPDPNRARQLITDLVMSGCWDAIGFYVSGAAGHNDLIGAGAKLFSVNNIASSSAGISTSLSAQTVGGRPVIRFPDAGAFAKFIGMARTGATLCGLMIERQAVSNYGTLLGMRWTAGGNVHYLAGGSAVTYIQDDNTNPWVAAGDWTNLSANVGGTVWSSGDVATHFLDFTDRYGRIGKNGIWKMREDDMPVQFAAGAAFDVSIIPLGGGNLDMQEAGMFTRPLAQEKLAELARLRALAP